VVTANDEPSPVEGDTTGRSAKKRRRLIIGGVVLAALVVLLIAVLPQFSMMQPNYYGRYPGLSARMDSWRNSTHARMGCVSCHVEPGLKGYVNYGLAAIPDFYSQLFFGAKTTNMFSPPTVAACQKCHTNFREVSPGGDLKIPHKAHVVVLKMNCVDCHKNLVHSNNRQGFNRPEMQTCLKCHNGDKASNKCVDCHTQKITPPTHKQKDWLQVHSSGADLKECSCHSWTPEFCAECHEKRPASHVGNWKKNHGPEAKKRGQGCLVCHGGEKFCKQCH